MTNEQIKALKRECIALRRCTGTDAGIISDTIDHLHSQKRLLADGCVGVQVEVMQTTISVLDIASDWNAPTHYDVKIPDVLSDCVDDESHEPTWLALYMLIPKLKSMIAVQKKEGE